MITLRPCSFDRLAQKTGKELPLGASVGGNIRGGTHSADNFNGSDGSGELHKLELSRGLPYLMKEKRVERLFNS